MRFPILAMICSLAGFAIGAQSAEVVPEYAGKTPLPQWFDVPEDIKARVLWEVEAPKGIFKPLGFSRDGQYFLLKRSEVKLDSGVYGKVVAASWHTVRLSDGKLLPLAVFPGDFALAPLYVSSLSNYNPARALHPKPS